MTEHPTDQSFIKALTPILWRITFGIVLGLVLSEIILSILGLPKFLNAHSGPPQFSFMTLENGDLFYVNQPSSNIEFIYDSNPRGYFDQKNAVQHNTNSMGFRGQEYVKEKEKNTVRIAFLGDSFTFGEGVRDEDLFSNKLAKKLNENSPDIAYETYNFGVGGYNTEQSVFLLKNIVLELNPDIVVLGYTLNDAEPKLFSVNESTNTMGRHPREVAVHEGLPDTTPPDTLFYKLRLSKLFWKAKTNKEISKQTINFYQSLYQEGNQDWITTQNSLEEFTNICRENEIECYFIMFPLLINLDENYPFYKLHEIVKSKIEPSGIPIIDILPALLGMDFTELWVHPTDQHPNEVAHNIIAEFLYKVF